MHKRGQCNWSEAEKIMTSEIRLQLFEKMEDFQQRRCEDCKMEKMLRSQTMIMKETIDDLMNMINENGSRSNQTVITKPKAPPV